MATISGTSGNDFLSGGSGNDDIDGLEGNDVINGGGGNDIVDGGDGDDLVRGNNGDDQLSGGSGNDNLRGGAGVDSFDGGSNTEEDNFTSSYGDRISFYELAATSGVIADLRTGVISNDGFGNVETMVNIESLGSDTAFVDRFYGDDGRNAFLGNRGDYLYGFAGNDSFYISSAAAMIDGGSGLDELALGSDGGWLSPDADGDGLAELAAAATSGWSVNLATGRIIDGYGNIGSVVGVENVFGSALNDVLTGDAGDNVLDGGEGNDTLRGGGGADQLYGGAGNDFLSESAGDFGPFSDDLYDGGAGNDRVSLFTTYGPGVTVDLRISTAQNTGSMGTDTFVDIEHVTSNYGDDTLTGNDADNWFWTFSGFDTLSGNGGNDYFTVGAGDKVADGGSGIDTIEIADFAFQPVYTSEGITVSLALQGAAQAVGTGNWTLTNIENLGGFTGDDELTGDDNANVLAGHLGHDTLVGGGGNDVLAGDGTWIMDSNNVQALVIDNIADGEGGDDLLIGGAGNDTLYGGRGNDTLIGGADDDSLDGSDGHDYLEGGAGNDSLTAGAGDDYLYGNAGDDLLDGGEGFDRVGYSAGATSGVTVDLGIQGVAQDTGQGFDTLVGIEHVSGTRFDDVLTGNAGDNWLWGGSNGSGVTGNDVISGGDGNDLVEVGAGNHSLDGGAGRDTLSLHGNGTDISPAGVTFSLALQGSAQDSGQGLMTAVGFEDLTGSIYDDSLSGDAGNNDLFGDLGNDMLSGGDGDDTLYGDGGVHPDTHGTGRSGPITAVVDVDEAEGGADTLVGGGGNDAIYGGAGDDHLDGGAGNDLLDGGSGNDYMVGGAGDDVYVVNPGDGMIEQAGEGTDEIRTSFDWGLQDNFENLTATGSGNIYLGGNALDNVLTGNAGNNYMVGEAGNDTLDGGDGWDIAAFRLPPGTTGTLRTVATGDGSFLVQLVQADGAYEDVFAVTATGRGSATVTGLGRMAGLGTDSVTSVEDLHFYVDNWPAPIAEGQFVNLLLDIVAMPIENGFAHVEGSVLDDVIDVNSLYPDAGVLNINVHGGLGDDVIIASAGPNYMRGQAGNDTIHGEAGDDGLAGDEGDDSLHGGDGNDYITGDSGDDLIDGGNGTNDVAAFQLPAGTPGTFSLVDGSGADAGKLLVQLTNGGVTETILKVTITGQGSATVEGVGSAAFLGTDTVTNVEQLHISVPGSPAQFLGINLTPNQFGTFVAGSEGADAIDLAAYPGAVNSNGNRGDDTIFGTADINFLNGGLGSDTLNGLGGDDRLTGGAGGDTLYGGDGHDTLIGAFNTGFGPQPGDGADVLRGEGGNDVIRGGDGDDLLEGGEGNDNLRGDAGSDVLDGGAGEDFVSYFFTALGSGITFDARQVGATSISTIVDPLGGTDTLIDIESIGIGGTDFDDILYGSEYLAPATFYANQMSGNGGNDVMYGAGNTDLLDGGSGNDTLHAGGGDDRVVGGAGDDTMDGGAGNDLMYGGDGHDTFIGGSGDELMIGEIGNDVLDGGTGMLDRAAFYLPAGTTGTYTIEDGTDSYAGQKVVVLTDGASSAIIAVISQNGATLTVTGVGAGASLGTDTLTNVDRLLFGTMPTDGGTIPAGAAVLEVASGVAADGLIAGADVFMDANGDGVWNIDEARTTTAQDGTFSFLATGSGPLVVVGGTNTDTGLPNLVTLTAPAGSSVINPLTTLVQAVLAASPEGTTAEQAAQMVQASLGLSAGVDLLNTNVFSAAALGDPEALEAQKAAAVVVSILVTAADAGGAAAGAEVLANLAAMVVTVEAGGEIDLSDQSTIEEALSGALEPAEIALVAPALADAAQQIDNATDLGQISEAQAEALTSGNDLDNLLIGGERDDELSGFGGNDSISGNGGDDRLDGGAGDDQLDGGLGRDTAAYGSAAAGVTVDLGIGTASGGAGNDTLVGIENVIGSGFADLLTGDAANNMLDAGAGNDSLIGGGGNDMLTGGTGADRIDGGTGLDTADYGGSGAAVSINLASGKFSGGDATGDMLISIENVTGSAFDDKLIGEQGSNVLNGGAGSDTLNGGGGADQLWGGAGSDLFVFKSASEITSAAGSDAIMDFEAGGSTAGSAIDKIDLSTLDANSKTKTEDGFTFIGDGAFTGQAGQLRVETDGNGKSTVMGDTDGNGIADFTLVVFHTGVISADDFWL